ncbi:hypothetical protein KGF45_13765 [Clostridioides sp. ZZV14-6154]|uniref:hypothetical protein n=1 Tax=unclassified Clostridioides TaxID=2635829 RepID=UPI001D1269AE|nr:hypothetical protein [Clostridioides sp. ZZV15-6388]MCC0661343.1 hypothetical protein [Clostridioides sp. ZZV14-6154]MCC0669841.1 hypothetical protein [Clostridioides sp. ZZV14-6153]MCC0727758.1 hypothetical protein [Clostridioides sp. ZZV14-6045]MCC0732346.1 hypothetical protein [Clostridioides sp. ZZV14-6048]MCC0736213.1 hypothetical protein [Clostridioides sp. ZZV14-6009]MCC0740302.1 hypothetical protein [Clostridioides sp. ZZV14-5902]WLD26817.1 hypothetical protein CDIFMA2_06890 [Clos
MEKCEIDFVEYKSSDTITKQCKRSDIRKYTDIGYYVDMHKNGNWFLKKMQRLVLQ